MKDPAEMTTAERSALASSGQLPKTEVETPAEDATETPAVEAAEAPAPADPTPAVPVPTEAVQP